MRRVPFSILLIVALALGLLAQAQQSPQPDPKAANYQAKGDQARTYKFPGTNEDIAYHVYVPTTWDKSKQYPLIIATHGAGQAPDVPFQRGTCAMGKMAEERGYIVAAVVGYHGNATALAGTNGGWNNPYDVVLAPRAAPAAGAAAGGGAGAAAGGGGRAGAAAGAAAGGAGAAAAGGGRGGAAAGAAGGGGGAAAGGGGRGGAGAAAGGAAGAAAAAPAAAPDPCMGTAPKGGGPTPTGTAGFNRGTGTATAEDQQRAELDILYVRDLVAKEYNVDQNRVYLMGNSTGGGAVWSVALRYPQLWTAISPSAGALKDDNIPYENLRTVAVLAVAGDKDTTVSYEGSKVMVEHAKARGVDAAFLGVPNGMHTDAWAQPDIIKQTFDFFDKHKTKAR